MHTFLIQFKNSTLTIEHCLLQNNVQFSKEKKMITYFFTLAARRRKKEIKKGKKLQMYQ